MRSSIRQMRVALGRIRELWNQTPRPTIQEIAKEIGRPTATVAGNIKMMRHRGELQ
jgi:predicted transcriptional regulator